MQNPTTTCFIQKVQRFPTYTVTGSAINTDFGTGEKHGIPSRKLMAGKTTGTKQNCL